MPRFPPLVAAYSQDLRRIARADCWAYFVAAAVIAGVAAHAAYHLWAIAPTYRDFVAGSLAWRDGYKGRDYAMLCMFVVAFLVALPTIARVSVKLAARTPSAAAQSFHGLMAMALLPAAIWFFGLLLTRNVSLALVYLACGLVAAVLVLAAILTARSIAFWEGLDGARACSLIGQCVVVLCIATCAGAAFAVAVGRLGVAWSMGPWAAGGRLGAMERRRIGSHRCGRRHPRGMLERSTARSAGQAFGSRSSRHRSSFPGFSSCFYPRRG